MVRNCRGRGVARDYGMCVIMVYVQYGRDVISFGSFWSIAWWWGRVDVDEVGSIYGWWGRVVSI